jgi:hypothetical protein
MIRSILAVAGLAVAAFVTAPVAAHAATAPVVSVSDTYGVLTTPSPLHVGEKLTAFGYVTGTFYVTSVTADGPVDEITLNHQPVISQSTEVLDFRA